MLAWTLALLLTPALASACPVGARQALGGDWGTDTNWMPNGVPAQGESVCIPNGISVSVSGTELAGDLVIDAGGSLSVANSLTLTGSASSSAGTLSVDAGTLELATDLTVSDGPFTIPNGGAVTVDPGKTLTLAGGTDAAVPSGSGTIVNKGSVVVTGATEVNQTLIAADLSGDGFFSNDGPVTMTGGGSTAGTWQLGPGAGGNEPVLTLSGGAGYNLDGHVTNGGLGRLVLGNATITSTAADATVDLYEFDLGDPAGTLDFSTLDSPTSHFNADRLQVFDGNFEVDASMTAGDMALRAGTALMNGDWSASYLHWGGGDFQSGGAGLWTVDTLDMTVDSLSGDSGTRTMTGSQMTVTGAGAQAYPYATDTLAIDPSSILTFGPSARWVIGSDVDITGGGKIVDHGTIDKTVGTVGVDFTQIDPLVDVPDGTLAVSAGRMILSQPPVQYDGGLQTLTAGTWLLSGILRLPGPISTLSTAVQFTGVGKHLEDSTSGNTDALTTLTSNASGNTMTLASGALLAPPPGSDFTNGGTINLTGTATIDVDPAKSYIQATNGAVTNLSSASAALTAGTVAVSRGRLGGIGTVNGTVQNTGGTVAPGNSPGTLTINGNYTQSGTGLLSEEIDGPAAGQFDQLIVTGTATLGGTLLIGSTNGYQPPAGQPFDVVTAGALAGPFDGLIEPPIAPYFDPAYSGAAMRLTANGVSISDVTVNEGNSGTTNAVFTISLGQAAPAAATVDWATQDGSAVAGSDYTAASGTVSFAPGETTKTVTVPVSGDTQLEPTENFAVNLSNPVGTRILDSGGVGTITNDDSPQASTAQVQPGDIDGFPIAPPPVQGKAVNVAPDSGTVKVKLPGTRTFVVLPDEEQVPVGTIIDATKGVVRLFSVGKNGRLQSALFYEGVFQVSQKPGQPLTTLTLVGGSFAGCPKASKASISAKRRTASSSVRHLWGSGAGQFRTAGRYASATIRGTKWLTDDRCNGTLIRVAQGSVTVRDLTLNKTLVLKKPKSYLAKKKGSR